MKKVLSIALALMMALSLLTACGNGTSSIPASTATSTAASTPDSTAQESSQFPREETFYFFSGMGVLPTSFNPLLGNGTEWPSGQMQYLLYEALFMMDMLSGELKPLIADSYEVLEDNSVKIVINEKAHFNDGTPLTAEDVKFSYDLGDKYDLQFSSYWDVLESVEVVDETTDLPAPKAPVQQVRDGGIEFEHVTFKYKHGSGQPVLNDVTFSIRPGETLGIIGGTGSAKSSLVQLIPRLYDAETGSVKVGGVDVKDYSLDVLRREVSMVLQKNVLFSGTILDNLRWGDENASEEECIRVAKLACADEFIERFPDKYNTWIEQGGSNVSGGQKQRLTIARALLRKPKVLILDDSTSAVDTATDAKIRKAFREEIPGTTKIIIAQRISSVQDADRILVLDNGQINGLGTHEELLRTNKIYQEVYNSQTQGGGDFDKQGGEQ